MNKLKLISVTVLCALALSACVDDKESASVTALREAKTSYLKAQADYQTAQAEVAKINAEVAKAKAEAEVAIARLQAEAEAAKTEAETKEIQLRAEAAQKEFEAKLAAIEAQAKAEAAYYAAAYQEYLNQLADAERQAVMDQQRDLVEVIGFYKETLGAIREAENTISNKTLEIADLNRQKLEALAGNALASAKNAVLKKQAEISGYKIQLQQYQIWYEADAAAKKVLVEKLREGLPGKADAVKAAQDKYLAVDEQIAALEEQNTALNKVINGYYGFDDQYNNIHFAGKLDTLGNAWTVLNDAELSIHSRSIYYYIGYEGSYFLDNIKNIKYYSWEVDKLLTDMDKELVHIKAELTETDTLTAATKTLEALFAKLEKAQKVNEDANKAWNAASEVVDKAQTDVNKANDALIEAQNSGDQAKITAAAAALDKAQEALTKAQEALNKASEVVNGKFVSGVWVPGTESNFQQIKYDYENKRNANKSLENYINQLKTSVESAEERIEEVKAAKEICFGDLLERVVAVYEEYVANFESINELNTERADLWALYDIANSEYEADKDIVASWDLAVKNGNVPDADYLGVVEKRINKLEGKIATAEAELQNLNDILADPEKIDQKYCTHLNDQIKQVEKDLAAAQDELETEKVKAAAYKATIDAWSMGEAE